MSPPAFQIGKCRYIMCGTFETGRPGLDASLESGLEAHRKLVTSAHPESGGVGADPFITIGAARESTHCATSKGPYTYDVRKVFDLNDEIFEPSTDF